MALNFTKKTIQKHRLQKVKNITLKRGASRQSKSRLNQTFENPYENEYAAKALNRETLLMN